MAVLSLSNKTLCSYMNAFDSFFKSAWHPRKGFIPIAITLLGIVILIRELQSTNALLVDYQYYTLKTVEKWQNRFCVDTKNVRFNVFNFWLHQNHIDMDWMGAFEPTP